jgi:hypothetical protein
LPLPYKGIEPKSRSLIQTALKAFGERRVRLTREDDPVQLRARALGGEA